MDKPLRQRLREIKGVHTAEIFRENEQAKPDQFTVFVDLNELHDVLARIQEEFDDDEINMVENDVAVSFFYEEH